MQTAILAAALLLGASPAETGPVEVGPVEAVDAPVAEPHEFLAQSRPYTPSITVYYPSPTYNCYSHGHRGIECYPAFCERHYRRPYNYRVQFDYPWHEDVYRNWPDACVYDDSTPLPIYEASKSYSGARRGSVMANRAAPAPRATTVLREAPSPR
jgi:hypothetical protein